MRFIILSCLLVLIHTRAYAVSAEWACSSTRIPVEISLDEDAKLQLKPDVLVDVKKRNLSQAEILKCTEAFRHSVSQQISKFKNEECPASKHDFCFTSASYIDTKIGEKIDSTFEKKSRGQSKLTAEEYLEEKIAKKEIDPSKLGQSFTYNNKTHKVSEFDKVIAEHIENVFMQLSRNEAKQYVQNYMVANAEILNVERTSSKRTAVLNNLNQMFGYIYGDKGPEELTKMLECKPEDDLKPIEEIIHRVEKINKVAACQPLKPGDHKVFEQLHSNYYGTGDYLLKRKNDGNYQAVLNVKFKAGSGRLSPQEMMNRSKNCLAKASPYMKGPKGELIELTVMSQDEINGLPRKQRPKGNVISIEGPNFGTNAASYAEDVDCDTITHEMLHLLGLCDEYEETRQKYGDMWNCRVVTKEPSIMRELSVFNKAVPQNLSCDCKLMPCSSIMKSSNEDVKKLYTAQTALSVIDYRFRAQYCKNISLVSTPNLKEPSRAMILKTNTERSFVVESRTVSSQQRAPHYFVERYDISCNCPSGDNECLQLKESIVKKVMTPKIGDSCPRGSKPTGNQTEKKFSRPQVNDDILYFTSEPQIESLLQPGHFHKILEGTCPGQSAGYQECADFAYKNNRNGSCNVPKKCYDDSYYLGVQK